jgi:hypothetical protein
MSDREACLLERSNIQEVDLLSGNCSRYESDIDYLADCGIPDDVRGRACLGLRLLYVHRYYESILSRRASAPNS